jgi:hypothetical protein
MAIMYNLGITALDVLLTRPRVTSLELHRPYDDEIQDYIGPVSATVYGEYKYYRTEDQTIVTDKQWQTIEFAADDAQAVLVIDFFKGSLVEALADISPDGFTVLYPAGGPTYLTPEL